MSNINLSTEEKKEFNTEIFKSAQFILTSVLMVLVLIYGVFYVWVRVIDNSILQVGIDYDAQKRNLVGAGNVNAEVFDLQKRMTLSKALIVKKSSADIILTSLGSNIIEGVSLNSVKYTAVDNKIIIDGNANSLFDLAKQISSLKKVTYFDGIIGDIKTSLGKNSGVDFSFAFEVNNLSI